MSRDPELFVETSAALPLVTLSIGLRAGASTDPPGKEGLSRCVARMLRRGVASLDHQAIEERLDLLGGEFGADASAGAITLHAEVISRNLDPFFALVTELIGAPTFPEEDLGKLVREMQAEIVESRDSDRSLANRGLRRKLFDGHPYGRRVSGSLASLERIRREDVVAWYRAHFTAQNLVFAFSGDIDEAGARRVAEGILARLPAGPATIDDTPEPPGVKGRHLVLVDRPDRSQVQLVIGGLGSTPHDPHHLPWVVGNTAFGGTFTSRLMQEVRAKRGWSYGASSRIGYDRRRDAFTIWSAPGAADAAACLELELGLVRDAQAKGLEGEELEFVRKYLVRSHAFEVDTARKRVAQPLEEALYALPPGYHAGWVESVRAVDLQQVNAALAARMPVEDFVVSAVVTRSETGDALVSALGDLDSVTVLEPDFE